MLNIKKTRVAALVCLVIGITSFIQSQTLGSSETIYFTTDGKSGSPSVIPSGFVANSIWEGSGSTWDGHIYTCISDHQNSNNGVPGNTAVFHWDPYKKVFKFVKTIREASQAVNNWMPNESQEKIHTPLIQLNNGEIWMASHDNSDDDLNRWHRGSHWYAINNQGELVDKSVEQNSASTFKQMETFTWDQTHVVNNPKTTPTDSTGIAIHYESIMGIGYNPQKPDVIYGSTYPRTFIIKLDLNTMESKVVGSGREINWITSPTIWSGVTRHMVSDKFGNAYAPGSRILPGYQITKYDYALDSSYVLQTGGGTGGQGWSGHTQTFSGESLYVIDGGGTIRAKYPEIDTFISIVTVPVHGPNLLINRTGTFLYNLPPGATKIKKINIATGNITEFGNISALSYPFSSHNMKDTLGYAYYASGGSNLKLIKVYLGKDELGPYKPRGSTAINNKTLSSTVANDLVTFPNPLINGENTIRFSLKESGPVSLAVYNSKGQKVFTLLDGHFHKGEHIAKWNGRGNRGEVLSAGIYFYQLKKTSGNLVKRIVLVSS